MKRARTAARRAELEEEMRALPLPPALAYLWNAFQRLSARRPQNGMVLSHIPWSEIAAFSHLTGLRLAAWEVAVIEELDGLLLAERSKSPA
ncbi:phage tail assembly chaperone [Chelatococcus asaccharovorans]|uniref:phage tail assembly chaperone n=1 Tax=Chelatococcus asaccharovorans TaxID=28210 RepID=UPI00224C6571|nr:hypothetical protein [Chelatococcus asaccharovorans]CAH1672076.1 hypothetical protein CHELA17_61329 [Chelatococcus asaccharovorans]CAH1676507.1 hypothetical protein CHELA40_14291 [Chelatococcus asaccharovorans]